MLFLVVPIGRCFGGQSSHADGIKRGEVRLLIFIQSPRPFETNFAAPSDNAD